MYASSQRGCAWRRLMERPSRYCTLSSTLRTSVRVLPSSDAALRARATSELRCSELEFKKKLFSDQYLGNQLMLREP